MGKKRNGSCRDEQKEKAEVGGPEPVLKLGMAAAVGKRLALDSMI